MQINDAKSDRWKFYKAVWFTVNKDRDCGCVFFTYHKLADNPNIELSPNAKLVESKILKVLEDYKDLIC